MKAKDIPIGRIGKHKSVFNGDILLFNTYGGHLFKFWPDKPKATLESADNDPSNKEWEVELLPTTTTVTFTFDGVNWSRPANYRSEYDSI